MVSNGLNYPVNHPTITLIVTFIAIFTLAVKAHASAYPAKIKQQAEDYLYSVYSVEQPLARTNIQLRPPSPQLKLARCKQPISFKHAPSRASRVSIAAQCSQPKWQVFLTGTVEQWLPVVHTTRPLNKGTILGAKDLALIETDVRKVNRTYFTDRAELYGRQLKRTLNSKKVITAQTLAKHLLVRKGDQVVIEAKNGSMLVRMNGTALEDGEQGKQINVRNTRSGRTVRAYVSRVGVVSVTR